MTLAAFIARIDRMGALGALLIIVSSAIAVLAKGNVVADMVGYAFLLTGAVLVTGAVVRLCGDRSIRVATRIGVAVLALPGVYYLVTI